uniref:R-spondin 3 n=1 Tax=Salarias fasciatus TaxID=181472 RepID=A0A672H4I8_SALFA
MWSHKNWNWLRITHRELENKQKKKKKYCFVVTCNQINSLSHQHTSVCPSGCATCSPLNGCLSCKPRLFFHLEQDGMRQKGTCLTSCPRGHYGVRSPHISTCTRCKVDCASCFSENFCTQCHPGHFLYRGKCESSCPKGLTANTALRECTVHCEVGEWTVWGPCVRKQNTRAYRRGEEARTRQVLHSPSFYGNPCPHVSEIRK